MRIIWVALMTALVGSCTFERPADVGDPIDAALDSPPPECEASTRSCTGERYTECGADGRYVRYDVPNGAPDGSATTLVMHDYACPLGCHATEPRCLDVAPGNDLADAMDTTAVSPEGLDLVVDDPSEVATITDVHLAGATSVTIAFSSGANIEVPAELREQPGGPPLRVLQVRSLTITAGTTLKLRGIGPFAIVSHFDIYVGGVLDDSGTSTFGGAVQAGCDIAVSQPTYGGGGNAGAGGASSRGQAGGSAQTLNPMLEPIVAGCDGGYGTGGGGLQLVSRRRIAVAGTGRIDVAGERGQALGAGSLFSAGGGGAGGNLLIETPALGLASGALLLGRGGSGGAGNTATDMGASGFHGNGDPQATTVPGARCPGCDADGGDGSTERTNPTAGRASGTGVAGGGGSIGRTLVRTRSPLVPPIAAIKIHYTGDYIRTR